MRVQWRNVFIGLATLAVAAPVLAQQPVGPLTADEQFRRADANGDGKIDKAELKATLNPDAQAFVDAVWENRDSNKDGWLSKEELTYNGPARRGGRAALPVGQGTAPTPK